MMEDEFQEKLEEIYDFPIDVKFKDFRHYDIYCRPQFFKYCIPIIYDAKATFETNIHNAVLKIDNEIIRSFKKGR